MNRLKVWVYALLVVAVAAVTLREHTRELRDRALADVDARLAGAAAQVGASHRAIAREASAAAAFAVRDEKLVFALHAKEQAAPSPGRAKGKKAQRGPQAPPVDEEAQEAALSEAARAALANAEKTFGFTMPDTTVVTAGNREWLARKGPPSVAEAEPMTYLRASIAGESRRGWVRLDGKLWYAAAAPAGDGAGLVVLVPLDAAWAKPLAAAAGADVSLSVPEVKPVSTARPADAQALGAWTRGAGPAVDVGQAGPLEARLGPMDLPKLPLLFVPAPALRARAIAIEGVKGGFAIVSAPVPPGLNLAAAFQWRMIVGTGMLLLVGFVLGFFVGGEGPAPLPDELVQAAARVESGDFSARAPMLAGKLGTIAAALNKAAALAGPAAAMATARPSVTDEFFGRAPREPEPEAGVGRPLAPAPEAAPAPAPAIPPPPVGRGATASAFPATFPAASAPDLLGGAARTAAPASPEVDEEAHWQQVFQDFLRTRSQCGEPSEGLTYEKFRGKLEGNKAALVAKYGCKTVRFQVYVKEGKAALKATPVK